LKDTLNLLYALSLKGAKRLVDIRDIVAADASAAGSDGEEECKADGDAEAEQDTQATEEQDQQDDQEQADLPPESSSTSTSTDGTAATNAVATKESLYKLVPQDIDTIVTILQV
jgi:hypothetical protein